MTATAQEIEQAANTLRAATGRDSLTAALQWITKDYALADGADLHTILRALAVIRTEPGVTDAARVVARKVSASQLDTATVLMRPELIPDPHDYEVALRSLADHCPDGRLPSINPEALLAAQRKNPLVMDALCHAAGLPYGDLKARVSGLPAEATSAWSPRQVEAALAELDRIVRGTTAADLDGAVAVRALELIQDDLTDDAAWERLQHQLERGVSYGTLLAQRAAGSSWLAHRNKYSGLVAVQLASKLCGELDARGINYVRSSTVGGDAGTAEMRKLRGDDQQLSLVALAADAVVFGVIFSIARDSGTAKANVGKIIKRERTLPTAVVVAGPGWSQRNDTAELAMALHGRMYSDRELALLADEIAATTKENL